MAVMKKTGAALAAAMLPCVLLTGCAGVPWSASLTEAAQALTSGVIRAEILAQLYLILCASLAVNAAFFLCWLWLLVRTLWKHKKAGRARPAPQPQAAMVDAPQAEPESASVPEQAPKHKSAFAKKQPCKKVRAAKEKASAKTVPQAKAQTDEPAQKKPVRKWPLFERRKKQKKESTGMKVPAFFAQFPQAETEVR